MSRESVLRRTAVAVLTVALMGLAGCGGGAFRTTYDSPVPPEVSRGWRLADVTVAVPEALKVSEARSLLPRADIVWREDPPGDRHPQVAAIMETAVRQGAAALRGGRPVRIALTMTRFHALTFEAETRLSNAGVHDVEFNAEITDARTGEVLKGPERIEASLPALAGGEMRAARARGETQKSQIIAHVALTIAGWLSVGPDNRTVFNRLGG